MKYYTFHVYIGGQGNTPEEAWDNAVEGLLEDGHWEYDGETYMEEEIEDED